MLFMSTIRCLITEFVIMDNRIKGHKMPGIIYHYLIGSRKSPIDEVLHARQRSKSKAVRSLSSLYKMKERSQRIISSSKMVRQSLILLFGLVVVGCSLAKAFESGPELIATGKRLLYSYIPRFPKHFHLRILSH